MRRVGRAAIGLALLAGSSGCVSSLQPAIEAPQQTYVLAAHYSGGKLDLPEPNRTVTLPPRPYSLLVQLVDYPGFAWQLGTAQNSTMLPALSQIGPPICPRGIAGCASLQQELYGAEASGKTTIVFTLVATEQSSHSPVVAPSASAAADAPACPDGISVPPPSSDVGCVVGRVTLTVVVP